MTPASRPWQRWRRRLLLLLVVAAAGVGAAWVYLLHFRLPAPTGPYAVGTRILSFTDAARGADGNRGSTGQRELTVQLWYPAAPSSLAVARYSRWSEAPWSHKYLALLQTSARWNAPPAPGTGAFHVLLLDHRFGGMRTQETALAEDLASHGYLLAAPDHTGNAKRVELRDGTVVKGGQFLESQGTAAGFTTYWKSLLPAWTADDRFVLDELARLDRDPGDLLAGRMDTEAAGALGHSFGGAAALSLLGTDPRIRGAINFDGFSFGALRTRTDQPMLILYEAISIARKKQLAETSLDDEPAKLDREDFAGVDASLARGGGDELFVTGAQHLDFSDEPLLPPLHRAKSTGPVAPARVQQILRTVSLHFFDEVLRGAPGGALPAFAQGSPDVVLQHSEKPGR